MNSIKHQTGFTIIELMLAMGFVSVLLISIAMLTIQMSNQYTRGVTLKEVAQAGTEVTSDMKRTIRQAQITDGKGIRLVRINTDGWALCTGAYTYVANNPVDLENDTPNVVKFTYNGNSVAARLAKVRDIGGSICTNGTVSSTDYVELLSGGSRQLVVRDLKLLNVDANGKPLSGPFVDEFAKGRGYYTVEITIGTGVESEIESNTNCRTPDDNQSNTEFCAIDTFTFSTRVGNSEA